MFNARGKARDLVSHLGGCAVPSYPKNAMLPRGISIHIPALPFKSTADVFLLNLICFFTLNTDLSITS